MKLMSRWTVFGVTSKTSAKPEQFGIAPDLTSAWIWYIRSSGVRSATVVATARVLSPARLGRRRGLRGFLEDGMAGMGLVWTCSYWTLVNQPTFYTRREGEQGLFCVFWIGPGRLAVCNIRCPHVVLSGFFCTARIDIVARARRVVSRGWASRLWEASQCGNAMAAAFEDRKLGPGRFTMAEKKILP